MEFRVLGPLEVVGDDGPIALHRGKEQALLAFMLLHPNELLPSDRLIDELWDGRPPATASKILQNAVSQLRKALGDGRLETRPPGYVFQLGPGELDLQRFEDLAREGRSEEALALWRGPPLVELREERFAEDARRRLEDARLAVLEDRIDVDLAAGRNAELVPELESLVTQHPLRERLQAQLMRALYASGRQADALDAYRRARRVLSEELGLEPGPELQELERKILQQDPALAPAARQPPRRPTRRPRRSRLLLGALIVVLAAAVAGVIVAIRGDVKPMLATPNSLAVIDPGANRVTDVVTIGGTPRGVTVGKQFVWAANAADGTVSQIDPKDLSVVHTIGLGASATDLVETAGEVWVATGSSNTLVRLDAHSGGILGSALISRDLSASAYTIDASPGAVWVGSGDALYKVDPVTHEFVAHRREIGAGTNGVAAHAGSVWLATSGQGILRVSATDLRTRALTRLGTIPVSLTVAEGSVWAGASAPYSTRPAVWRLDEQTARVVETTVLPGNQSYPPVGLEVAYGEGSIWVAAYQDGRVTRLDPHSGTIISTIQVGGHPSGIAVGKGRVWVTVS